MKDPAKLEVGTKAFFGGGGRVDQVQFQKLLEQMGALDPVQFRALVQAYAK